jgi:hypothetical protein
MRLEALAMMGGTSTALARAHLLLVRVGNGELGTLALHQLGPVRRTPRRYRTVRVVITLPVPAARARRLIDESVPQIPSLGGVCRRNLTTVVTRGCSPWIRILLACFAEGRIAKKWIRERFKCFRFTRDEAVHQFVVPVVLTGQHALTAILRLATRWMFEVGFLPSIVVWI